MTERQPRDLDGVANGEAKAVEGTAGEVPSDVGAVASELASQANDVLENAREQDVAAVAESSHMSNRPGEAVGPDYPGVDDEAVNAPEAIDNEAQFARELVGDLKERPKRKI